MTTGRFAGLVGRAAELAAIRQELAAARAGTLRVLSIEGEAGIGKTRLLEAAAGIAAEEGLLTARASADEDLRSPFLVIWTFLDGLALAAPGHRPDRLTRSRAWPAPRPFKALC